MRRNTPEVIDETDALPRGQTRLVIRDEHVIVTIEGDHDEVQQRYREELAAIAGMSVDEYERDTDDLPMPEFDELEWYEVTDTDA